MNLAVPFLLAAASVWAQESAESKIDAIFKEWNRPDSPGAAVAVVRDGKLILSKGYGTANLEYSVPIRPDTVFHVASVSKQFTGTALVILEQRDKLSLEDDIRKHLPELPDYGKKIAISDLLQHTSGIRDQWQTLAMAGWRLDDVITQKQILRVLFRQKELNFSPRSEHLYSNGGYTLAAEIVARVAGKSFPEFCREAIFEPLGMKSTHFHDDHTHIDRNRAYSYSGRSSNWTASPLNYANAGATSLFTTAPDLALWLDNFRTRKIGNVGRLQEQAILADGRKIEYAMGVAVSTYRGLRTISHGGGDAGYRTFVEYFPDEKLGVVVLSNAGSFNPGAVANRVAEVYLESRMERAKGSQSERKFVQVDSASLSRFEGFYTMGPGLVLEIVKRGDELVAPQLGPLKPLAPNRFWAESASAEVHFSEPDKVVFTQRGVSTKGERLSGDKPAGDRLTAFAGTYWSDELETQYIIQMDGDGLRVDHIRHGTPGIAPRPQTTSPANTGSCRTCDSRGTAMARSMDSTAAEDAYAASDLSAASSERPPETPWLRGLTGALPGVPAESYARCEVLPPEPDAALRRATPFLHTSWEETLHLRCDAP